MKMPHGKFKDKEIELLPSWYLKWVAENWKEITPRDKEICEAADKEWQYREIHGMHFEEVIEDAEAPRQTSFKGF